MVGILLTLVAVLLVFCLAFLFDPKPDERFRRIEQLFFINSNRSAKSKNGVRDAPE